MRARVTAVVDGDTVNVRLSSGRRDRIRVIGIDAPERGACYATEATARTRALAGGRRVRLIGDAREPTRDRFGRRLAYMTLPNGYDLGTQLLSFGFAKVDVVGPLFTRVGPYTAAESVAMLEGRGMWSACVPRGADYTISVTDTPDPVAVNTDFTYRVVVSNAGPAAVSSLRVTSTQLGFRAVGGFVAVISASAPRGCRLSGLIYACEVGDLDPGASVEAAIVVRPLALGPMNVDFNVTSPSESSDPNQANNTTNVTTTVVEATPPRPQQN